MKSQKATPIPAFNPVSGKGSHPLLKDQNSSQGSGGSNNTDSPLTNKAIVQSIVPPSTNSIESARGKGAQASRAGFSSFSEAHQAKKIAALSALIQKT